VEFDRLALVLDSLKDGKIDFTFTNATAVRAKDMDFTVPLVRLELGYLVLGDSKLQSVTEIDKLGCARWGKSGQFLAGRVNAVVQKCQGGPCRLFGQSQKHA